MKVIAVTGSAGCGKTTYAKKLARAKGYLILDLTKLIKKYKLYESYDKKLDTYEVDTDELSEFLKDVIKGLKKEGWKGVVLDGHLSHYLSPRIIDEVHVMKCDIKTLRKRLTKRGYSKRKIEENIEAEIMETCIIEAKEMGHKIKIVRRKRNK